MDNVFDSIKIGLASPDMIRQWSYGEVTKPSSPAASRSIYVIVTPDMTETLEALAEMGVEMPAF